MLSMTTLCRSNSRKLIFLGPPEAPTNCSVVNQTTDSLVVECLPSFDGGLKQFFGLEVTDLQSGILLANFTDSHPEFEVIFSQNILSKRTMLKTILQMMAIMFI